MAINKWMAILSAAAAQSDIRIWEWIMAELFIVFLTIMGFFYAFFLAVVAGSGQVAI